MGNQLYEYATAKAMAVALNKKLVIDPRPILKEAPQRHYDLGLFNIQDEDFGSPFVQWLVRWVASVRLGKFFKTIMPFAWSYQMIRDKEEGFDESLLQQKSRNIVIEGYWQSFKYFESIRPTLLKELSFKDKPNAINQKYLDEIESVNAVAVHIRRGDYVANPVANAVHGLCDMDYYKKAIAIIKDKVENPYFFIFTDDPDWAEDNFKISEHQKIIKHNIGKQDHEDFRLLTNCKYFIIANSSFSWWGAWLSDYKNKIVISPNKWFNVDAVPITERIPESWIRV
ncbi:putative alpha-1,2-fucosyltransferase [Winogradskyella psychrotolerans RS-3]|uniref:Putative alpha-1,2-fucosyltransferase n=2 Tax=Winogradskyella TaxID=286104 RepID=S7XFL2_9FLAO|nr:putative alpha-1,2-fucosyltransferase [Winogradskyella psychrotolerans RS-3]